MSDAFNNQRLNPEEERTSASSDWDDGREYSHNPPQNDGIAKTGRKRASEKSTKDMRDTIDRLVEALFGTEAMKRAREASSERTRNDLSGKEYRQSIAEVDKLVAKQHRKMQSMVRKYIEAGSETECDAIKAEMAMYANLFSQYQARAMKDHTHLMGSEGLNQDQKLIMGQDTLRFARQMGKLSRFASQSRLRMDKFDEDTQRRSGYVGPSATKTRRAPEDSSSPSGTLDPSLTPGGPSGP